MGFREVFVIKKKIAMIRKLSDKFHLSDKNINEGFNDKNQYLVVLR